MSPSEKRGLSFLFKQNKSRRQKPRGHALQTLGWLGKSEGWLSRKNRDQDPRDLEKESQKMAKNMARGYRNIVLVGMPGTGKSTFAKSYAHLTRRSFLDFDRFVERFAGKTIPQIFSEDGEDAFRALEQKCLRKMERRQHSVIALGGGTPCSPENLELARSLGLVVLLETPLEILAQRLYSEKETRPLFAAMQSLEETIARVQELWEQRKTWYEQADLFLQTGFSSIDNLKLQLSVYEQRAFSRDYQRDVVAILGESVQSDAAQRRFLQQEKQQFESKMNDEGTPFIPSEQTLEENDAEPESTATRANARPHGRTSPDFFREVFSLEDAAGMGTKFGFSKPDRQHFPRNENRPRRTREAREPRTPFVPSAASKNEAPEHALENVMALQGQQGAQAPAPAVAAHDVPQNRRENYSNRPQNPRGPGEYRGSQPRPGLGRGPGRTEGARPFAPRSDQPRGENARPDAPRFVRSENSRPEGTSEDGMAFEPQGPPGGELGEGRGQRPAFPRQPRRPEGYQRSEGTRGDGIALEPQRPPSGERGDVRSGERGQRPAFPRQPRRTEGQQRPDVLRGEGIPREGGPRPQHARGRREQREPREQREARP